MDLPAKAQEENDLLEVRKHRPSFRQHILVGKQDFKCTRQLAHIKWKRRIND